NAVDRTLLIRPRRIGPRLQSGAALESSSKVRNRRGQLRIEIGQPAALRHFRVRSGTHDGFRSGITIDEFAKAADGHFKRVKLKIRYRRGIATIHVIHAVEAAQVGASENDGTREAVLATAVIARAEIAGFAAMSRRAFAHHTRAAVAIFAGK